MTHLQAQDRSCNPVISYNWITYFDDGNQYEVHAVSRYMPPDYFNPQNPQVVYEFPQMRRCDCLYQMYIACGGYTADADIEVYNDNYQYLFTFEDFAQNSYQIGEGCFDFPSDGTYYLKIVINDPGGNYAYGWYKIVIDKYSDIEDDIAVNVNSSEVCLGQQVCINANNVNFDATYYVYWNNVLIHSGNSAPPQLQYSYCFVPSAVGIGNLRLQVKDDCGGEANYNYNVNVRHATDFTLTTQVCVNQNITINSNNITWCNGPISGATFIVNWGDGNSSNGLPASHYYTTSGIYNVTLTINSTQGTQNIVKQIQVNPLPNNVTVTGARHTCAGQSTYTITNPQQGTTNSWSIYPTNCGSLSSNSGTSVNITWNPDNFPTENYASIIITSSNGCTNRDTIKVWKCCWREHPNNVPFIKYDQIFSGPLSNPDYFLNGVIEFQGTNTYNNINFHIGPETKIIINNNANTTFNNCQFSAECNYMWEGITIEQGSRLTVNGTAINSSSIRDAVNGIRSVNGARFTVYYTTFNRNLNGIDVQTYSGSHTGTVSKCIFKCTNDDDNQYVLMSPYSNRRSECGIKISGVNSIQIGNTASTTNQNIYKYMDYGVVVKNSNVTFYNNSFGPMPQGTNNTGYGIYSDKSSMQTARTINIGSTIDNAIYKNDFSNSIVGVYIIDYNNVNIHRNTFNNNTVGVLINENPDRAINITYNSIINSMLAGINMNNFANSSISINNNTISSSNEVFYTNGIYLTNNVASNTAGLNISSNHISGTKLANGILLTNVEGTPSTNSATWTRITNNDVTFNAPVLNTTTQLSGIRIEFSPRTIIENCTITHTASVGSTALAEKFAGVNMILSQYTYLCSNKFYKMGMGVRVQGNCNYSKFTSNRFDKQGSTEGYGIRCYDAVVGAQGTYAQPLQNEFYGFDSTIRRGNGAISAYYGWFYKSNSSIHRFSLNNPIDQNISSSAVATPNGIVSPTCGYPSAILGGFFLEGMDNALESNDSVVYVDNIEENKYQDAYMKYSNNQGSMLSVTNEVLEDEYSNISTFKTIEHLIHQREYEEAKVLNSSILPKSLIEENLVIVNEIYLRTWATGNYFIQEDDYNVLLDIASQDPVKGGWGVINAWVMTRRFNSDDKVDKMSNNFIKIKESKYRIQPNPANTSFMLSNVSDIDLIIVTNILGQDVLTINNFENNEITIDVSGLKKGIYIVRLKNAESQKFSVEKLIIE